MRVRTRVDTAGHFIKSKICIDDKEVNLTYSIFGTFIQNLKFSTKSRQYFVRLAVMELWTNPVNKIRGRHIRPLNLKSIPESCMRQTVTIEAYVQLTC